MSTEKLRHQLRKISSDVEDVQARASSSSARQSPLAVGWRITALATLHFEWNARLHYSL